jgi:hypothetical protein
MNLNVMIFDDLSIDGQTSLILMVIVRDLNFVDELVMDLVSLLD